MKDESRRLKKAFCFILPPSSFILLLMLLTACATDLTTSVAAPIPVAPTPLPGALYVNATNSIGPISPYVFGTNYGPWVFLVPAVKPQAVEAGLTYLRYPGGEYGDSVDLMEYQIDEAVALARELGAEPAISVRLMNGTPEAAANLVRYANKTKGYHIQFWSIGNEPNLYSRRSDGIPGYDTTRYNREWRAIAEAMRAVDPSIKLVGPDVTSIVLDPNDPVTRQARAFLEEFLRANGDLVDIVSFHRYPFPVVPSDPLPTKEQLLAASEEWDELVPLVRQIVKSNVDEDKPIAVTEVNSNWVAVSGGEATPGTLYNALWWGDSLGRMMRQGVDVVAQFLLTSQPGAAAGEMGLLARDEARPIYYVYPMYRRFGQELVEASTDKELISIYAARRNDGALTLMVINRGDQAQQLPVQLHGFTPSGTAEVYRLDETHNAEQIEPQQIADGSSIAVPPYSMTLYILP
jgi:hypothetical protein